MFIIACKATWIRGSGWTAVAGGADHLRAADPHHVVARVLPGLLAGSAQVVVIADDALVAEANDRGLVASIARDSMVGHICSNSRLLRLFHFLGGAHSCRELVHGAWQLGESQDEPSSVSMVIESPSSSVQETEKILSARMGKMETSFSLM